MPKKIIIIAVAILNLLAIIIFWAVNNTGILWTGIGLGRLTGLLAAYFLLIQLLFISRFKFLESVFGWDRLTFIHHLNGFLTLAFILLHPLFLALGYGFRSGRGLVGQLFSFWGWEEVPAAFLSVGLFILIVVLSIIFARGKMRYEKWYFIHLLAYLAVILSFSHQFELGADLRNNFFAAYYILLYVLLGLVWLWGRIVRPLWFFSRHRFFVSKIITECPGVVSVYISGRQMENYRFLAGQFVSIRFLNSLAYQSHPFSFSQDYNGRELRLTIKALGDFTGDLEKKIKVGDMVILEGPYGRFTLRHAKRQKLALIAGGIGITPIRSLVEAGKKENIDLKVIASFKSNQEFVFNSEIMPWAAEDTVIHYLASDQSGRLNEAKVKELIPDYLERDFYVCGPPAMTAAIVSTLLALGVGKKYIHQEKFSW
ncbi:MAG TPA: ferredoxin reductase family protein [bacterium]|nr:ferredoxin reductase family protein [bacterium]HPT29998.1 ferredoxin reductase family protein [bacterium]